MEYLLFVNIFVLFSVIQSTEAYTRNDTGTLHADLFALYNTKLRPISKTDISLQFGLMHITELDIVTQRLHTVGFLTSSWYDERLQWTPSNYGNMAFTKILLSDVWSPPLGLSNAANELNLLNDNSDLVSVPIYLQYDGLVGWMAPVSFIAQCTINIQYYPFDSQSCKLKVSSWMYLESEVALYAYDLKVNLDIYEEHGEWDITDTTVRNITRKLSGYHLPGVEFTLHLRRKYSYYLMNMILPVVVLAIMAPFVSILPVESGEKIGFALTILLSLSVVMTIVSDSIPPTSTHICVLSVYLLMTFIICSLETLVTVITCRVHELHNKAYLMGEGCQRVARILAKITRYRRRPKIGELNAMKEHHSTKVIQVEMAEKIDPSMHQGRGDKNKAVEVQIEYSYEDIVLMYEKFNFIFFTLLTSFVTLICTVVLLTKA